MTSTVILRFLNNARGLLHKLSRKLYLQRRLIALHRSLDEPVVIIKRFHQYRFKCFTRDDLSLLTGVFAHYHKDFTAFMQQGHTGFLLQAPTDETLVAVVWYATTSFRDPFYDCVIPVQHGEAFQMAGEVAPRQKRTAAAAAAMFLAWEYLRNNGVHRITTLVQDDNLDSLRFLLHAGCQESGHMIVIHRVLGLNISRKIVYSGERLVHLKKSRTGFAHS